MPLTTPFVSPLTYPIIKLSKLVNEARQLGRETFSSIVDAVIVKNWLKRVSDTLTNIKLDELKLRVATKLMDKSAIV